MSERQQATQDARPSGPSIRQLVFGAPAATPTTPGGGDPPAANEALQALSGIVTQGGGSAAIK